MSTVPNPHEPETILAHITPISPKPARDIYREALQVQDASNLSGVVHSLAGALNTIWDESRALDGGSTEYVNTHPVVKLYLSKLMSLAHYYDSIDDYAAASDACKAKAGS